MDKKPNLIPDLEHPLPAPSHSLPYQPGIGDPFWSLQEPKSMSAEQADQYTTFYAGRVDPQKFLTLLRADLMIDTQEQLKQVMQLLTKKLRMYVEKEPSKAHVFPFSHKDIPETYRVTVTLALGSTLFIDKTGFDRFQIRSHKPRFLKTMPSFPGDSAEFSPLEKESDIMLMICSDHPYVNTAIARDIAEKFNKNFRAEYKYTEEVTALRILGVEQGFGRPDKREFLRFDDGIDNIRIGGDLEKLVFISKEDPEPSWCVNGSYLVYRKVREMLPVWEAFAVNKQEEMIGRKKETGMPLSREKTGAGNLTPVYPQPPSAKDGPLNAHVRKVQPRRTGPDLFGVDDLDRRFLRRPYPYFEGIDENGKFVNGLQFIAFMKSIQQQFEHVTNMWQMNPDFPEPGTGVDAMYSKGVLQTADGGYYFCPPPPKNESDFFASALF